jgi:hypothetical protein
MWILIPLLIAGQADDILADEAKSKSKAAPPAATAPAELPPTTLPPAPGSDASKAAAPAAAPAAEGSAPAPPAAESTADGETKPEEKGLLHDLLNSGAMGYMIDGGIFMWPILALGILAFGVIIERFRALMMLNTKNEALRSEVRKLLEADRVEEALALCDREQGPGTAEVPDRHAPRLRSRQDRGASHQRDGRLFGAHRGCDGEALADPGHGRKCGADARILGHRIGHGDFVRGHRANDG